MSFVSAGKNHYAAILGDSIPDLVPDRQLVLTSSSRIEREVEDKSAREELFGRTEKPKERILDKEIQTNTTLDKMKEELFAAPSRQKKEEPKNTNNSFNNDARNELFSTPKKKTPEKAPVKPIMNEEDARDELFSVPKKKSSNVDSGSNIQKPAAPTNEEDDLQAFKAQLFGANANYFPDDNVQTPPAKKEEPYEDLSEEFIDELPENCTLNQHDTLRPNHLVDSDLPEPETLNGVDFLLDDDLL